MQAPKQLPDPHKDVLLQLGGEWVIAHFDGVRWLAAHGAYVEDADAELRWEELPPL